MPTDHRPPIWLEAASFAARAHRGQTRKDRRTPYAAHPVRVALTVASTFECNDETTLAAALLHDTIEDCTVDYDELHEAFGRDVADIVAALSKDKRLIEPAREEAYQQRLLNAPWQARLIKLADAYDNLLDAVDRSSRHRLLVKARDVLELAEVDPRLDRARTALGALIESVENDVGP